MNTARSKKLWVALGTVLILLGLLPVYAAGGPVFLPLVQQRYLPPPPRPHLLISEVLYSPDSGDTIGEWIEIYNAGDAPGSLEDCRLGDEETPGGGEGMLLFPPQSVLEPGEVLVVAAQATVFYARYGFNPDYEWLPSDATVPDLIKDSTWGRGRIELVNSGDEVLLLGPVGERLDAVSWGSSTVAFKPAVKDAGAGASIERYPAGRDTDQASDWRTLLAPAPGQVDIRWPTPTITPTRPPQLPTPTPTPSLTPTAPYIPARLLISEVLADPLAVAEPDGEWLEVFNPTNLEVRLDAYRLGDEELQGGSEGMAWFPPGASIAPGGVVLVAFDATIFRQVYGFAPHFELSDSDPNVPDMVPDPEWANGSILLSNGNDEVLLLDPFGHLVDSVSWGSSVWAFDPSVHTPCAGCSMERRPGNQDRDQASDWVVQDQPRPGTVFLLPPTLTPTPTATGQASATSTPSPPAGPWVLLSEVMVNPVGEEPQSEWIELINVGADPANLGGYQLGDNEDCGLFETNLTFPAGTTLDSGLTLVVANRAQEFFDQYAFLPNFELQDSLASVPELLLTGPCIGLQSELQISLHNQEDEVLLVNASGEVVDAISYGGSTWAFTPAIPLVAEGHSLERRPPWPDTDRASDWVDQAFPSPGLPPAP